MLIHLCLEAHEGLDIDKNLFPLPLFWQKANVECWALASTMTAFGFTWFRPPANHHILLASKNSSCISKWVSGPSEFLEFFPPTYF